MFQISLGQNKSNSKKEVYGNAGLTQETWKENNLIWQLNEFKKEQTKPRFSRMEENHRGNKKRQKRKAIGNINET